MNNWCIVGFSRIFLLGMLIFKGLTARHLYKSFGVKGLNFKFILLFSQAVADPGFVGSEAYTMLGPSVKKI
jgi:hypothetical protein